MCTVSFITKDNNYYITSNRDEHVSRPSAFEPMEEIINSVKVLFPKDPKAGGTWFALNENRMVGVLLNGAFERHEPKGDYAKSRGVVLLEVVSAKNPMLLLEVIDLTRIEPFTLILFNQLALHEFRWDGIQKHLKQLDKAQNHIWSSVTLYDEAAVKKRTSLFTDFVNSNRNTTAKAIIDFHSNNREDYENGFIINRKTGLKTFSVTQAILTEEDAALKHMDLLNNRESTISLLPNKLTV